MTCKRSFGVSDTKVSYVMRDSAAGLQSHCGNALAGQVLILLGGQPAYTDATQKGVVAGPLYYHAALYRGHIGVTEVADAASGCS